MRDRAAPGRAVGLPSYPLPLLDAAEGPLGGPLDGIEALRWSFEGPVGIGEAAFEAAAWRCGRSEISGPGVLVALAAGSDSDALVAAEASAGSDFGAVDAAPSSAALVVPFCAFSSSAFLSACSASFSFGTAFGSILGCGLPNHSF